MSGTLRVLSALLAYPDAGLRHALPEMRDILREENALAPSRLDELEALMASIAAAQPLEAEADYVQLFDCGRATSLHLFEHVHGDSRERGAAMVDLARTYEQAGLRLAPGELPDYLPAVLEFAALHPPREARAFLGEIAHVLNSILAALRERRSAYAGILAALLELAGEKVQAVKVAPEVPIDEAWEEPAAFGGCPRAEAGAPQPIHVVRRTAPRGAVA
ncbi:MAG TPA: nitrate reductase molybdenum cofactor assembly chaperone [Usitatibacter sp.]|nr:nitrate reductase molybdenum cofactor assembly chaperone [Usitatibacter sp.]